MTSKKFVGASGKNGRLREVIEVDGDDLIQDVVASCGWDWDSAKTAVTKHLMVLFSCDRLTGKATLERGYHIVGFHKRITILSGPIDLSLYTS